MYEQQDKLTKAEMWKMMEAVMPGRSAHWCQSHYHKVFKRAQYGEKLTKELQQQLRQFVVELVVDDMRIQEADVFELAKEHFKKLGVFPDDVYVFIHQRFGQIVEQQRKITANMSRHEIQVLRSFIIGKFDL